MNKSNKITVLKSIIYDNTRLTTTNNKTSIPKLIYIYLLNLRLAKNKTLPTNKKIAQLLNIDSRSVKPSLELLISTGFLSVKNDTFEIFFESQITQELKIIDDVFLFSKEGNRRINFYRNYCGYYVKAPQEIIFNKELSANEKIYYLIFLDFFMEKGSLKKQFYKVCHLSKLIKEKNLSRKTVYETFSKLREKNFIKCDLIHYGSKANEKGFENLVFFVSPYNAPEQQKECINTYSEHTPEEIDEIVKYCL